MTLQNSFQAVALDSHDAHTVISLRHQYSNHLQLCHLVQIFPFGKDGGKFHTVDQLSLKNKII